MNGNGKSHTTRMPKEADIDRLLELTGGSVYLIQLHCEACCLRAVAGKQPREEPDEDDNFFARYV